MDFSLSMEHEILRKSVRDFAEKEIRPVARELDEKEEFSYDTMKAMADLGLLVCLWMKNTEAREWIMSRILSPPKRLPG